MIKRGIARMLYGEPIIIFSDNISEEGYCQAYTLKAGWTTVSYEATLRHSVSARKEEVQDIVNELVRYKIVFIEPEDVQLDTRPERNTDETY